MKRLTKRVDGIAVLESWAVDKDPVSVVQRLCSALADYEETLLEPKEVAGLCAMDKRSRMAKMLRWEEAEQDGRLVVLPCKVGDTVYYTREGWAIVEPLKVRTFFIGDPTRRGEILHIHMIRTDKFDVSMGALGKTVFLTREEAEAALKGGDSPENRAD